MEYFHIWNLTADVQTFIIVDPLLLQGLSSSEYTVKEEELIITTSICSIIYKKSLKALKTYRKTQVWSQDLSIFLDLAVLINGELSMAWNIKSENLDKLDIVQQIHINTLTIKLHRKAAVAWEFRKTLTSLSFPLNELKTLTSLQEFHKQNYYLWEYRRWVFLKHLSATVRESEYEEMLEYCSCHPSDSSAFHYLSFISRSLGCNSRTYSWVSRLCDKFYGVSGLYDERNPAGFETLCLLRAKTREFPEQDQEFLLEQSKLHRKTEYLYIKPQK